MVDRVAFIGISYASDDTAVAYARQLEPFCRETGVLAVLVDNGPNHENTSLAARVAAANPHIKYLNFGENLGYFGGADSALHWIREQFGAPRWVIVSNVDVNFGGNGFVHTLRDRPHSPDVGVLAPAIVSARSGLDQNPYFVRRPTPRRMHFYRLIFGRYWLRRVYEAGSTVLRWGRAGVRAMRRAPNSRGTNGSRGNGSGIQIYAPHGSCMLFTESYFGAGGTLRYPSFLFGEEIFVAESCRKRGLKVVYAPELKITHSEHTSTRTIPAKEIASYAAASAAYLAREFFDGGR